jgi:type VI protein secretion system component Hcp
MVTSLDTSGKAAQTATRPAETLNLSFGSIEWTNAILTSGVAEGPYTSIATVTATTTGTQTRSFPITGSARFFVVEDSP